MAKMAVFEVDGPKGKSKVIAPENATDEEIIAHYDKQRFPVTSENYDPTKGGTLSPLGMDTGIPLPAGVDRFLSGVGQHSSDMGYGMAQMIPGVNLSEEIKEKRRLDAPLASTTGGKAGKLTGALIPAVGSMAIPGANSYTGAALMGTALGLTEPAVNATEKLWNGLSSGLFGVGGRAAGELVGHVVRPTMQYLNPEQLRLSQLAQAAGIPLDAAARTGSKPLQIINSVLENLPFTAGREAAKKQATQEGFNRAVLEKTGSPATLATPDVLGSQKQALGREFEDIASRNKLQVTPQFAKQLEDIKAQAIKRLNQEGGPIASMVDDILSTTPKVNVNPGKPNAPFFGKANQTYGALEGKQYQGFREELGRLSKGDDTKAHYFGQIKKALDKEFSSQLSAKDAAKWKEISREYGNTKVVLDAMGGAGNAAASGNVSPAQLAAALTRQVGREGKAMGRGDMNDLAKAGQLFVRDQVPNSGTAQRMAYQSLLTGGFAAPGAATGFLMTGSPTAGALYGAASAGAGLMAPRLAQALLNNPKVAGYIVNQAGSPAAAAWADTLRRMGPSLGLSAPALLPYGSQQ